MSASMLGEIISPPYRVWFRSGCIAGFVLGAAAGMWLDWYFSAGPGLGGVDAGEAHGYMALMLGFPVSLLPVFPLLTVLPDALVAPLARTWAVLSIALTWAVVAGTAAAVLGLFVRRFRPAA